MRRPIVACVILVSVSGTLPALSQAQFPYERDLVLEARAMRGSKRLPVLTIEQNGRAQIDLWCKRGRGTAAIDGGAITITALAGVTINAPAGLTVNAPSSTFTGSVTCQPLTATSITSPIYSQGAGNIW